MVAVSLKKKDFHHKAGSFAWSEAVTHTVENLGAEARAFYIELQRLG